MSILHSLYSNQFNPSQLFVPIELLKKYISIFTNNIVFSYHAVRFVFLCWEDTWLKKCMLCGLLCTVFHVAIWRRVATNSFSLKWCHNRHLWCRKKVPRLELLRGYCFFCSLVNPLTPRRTQVSPFTENSILF